MKQYKVTIEVFFDAEDIAKAVNKAAAIRSAIYEAGATNVTSTEVADVTRG